MGEGFDPGEHDLIYIGGGQDRDQLMVAADMVREQAGRDRRRGRRRRRACSPSAAATSCSGSPTSSASERIEGLGLADLETVREPGERLIGNVSIEVDLGTGPRVLAGFENHGGRTYLGSAATAARPRARTATATTARDGLEGVVAGT